jgi:peptidyl-prolyl cis-trans isomerase B (cyclophilin B)
MTRAILETDKGTVNIQFFDTDAPNTVANFVKLAKSGFYDGLTFHRVIPNFMIQGGCPKGNGSGGPGYEIKDEINPNKHLAGSMSMAHRGPNTGGSQFFICHSSQPHLLLRQLNKRHNEYIGTRRFVWINPMPDTSR